MLSPIARAAAPIGDGGGDLAERPLDVRGDEAPW